MKTMIIQDMFSMTYKVYNIDGMVLIGEADTIEEARLIANRSV